jgi:hypothetical protein
MRLLYRPIIYEIYYHYYSSARLKEPPLRYTTKARHPENTPYLIRYSSQGLSLICEEPSLINISSKPEEYPLNYTIIKLFGKSSLTRQIELPDNRLYSGRHALKRLSHIPEELLPPMNFLNKPVLEKKKDVL